MMLPELYESVVRRQPAAGQDDFFEGCNQAVGRLCAVYGAEHVLTEGRTPPSVRNLQDSLPLRGEYRGALIEGILLQLTGKAEHETAFRRAAELAFATVRRGSAAMVRGRRF